MTLSGFELTDDFLHFLLVFKLVKLEISHCKCTFSSAALLKLLKHGADNGLQRLDLYTQSFEFTKAVEESFIHLLEKKEKWFLLIIRERLSHEAGGNNDSVEITNFRECQVYDDDSDYYSSCEAKKILTDLIAKHTRLTSIRMGGYSCDRDAIMQNENVTELTMGLTKDAADNDDLVVICSLKNLQKLKIMDHNEVPLQAAGLLVFITGPSCKRIRRIEWFSTKIEAAGTNATARALVYRRVAAINETRADGEKLVLSLGRQWDDFLNPE